MWAALSRFISLDFSLSLYFSPTHADIENFPVWVRCLFFRQRADFHIPAARGGTACRKLLSRCGARKYCCFCALQQRNQKRKTLFLFSLFLFPRSLFFFLSPHPIRASASTIFPAERNVNILRALPAAVCRGRAAFFIEMFYLGLLCRIIYYTVPKLRNKEFTCSRLLCVEPLSAAHNAAF